MAIRTGWVGSSAKAETGQAWMSEARVEVRLPRAGWMSEMVGMSPEIRYVNTEDLTEANIYELMGSPTTATVYVFENTATISAASAGGWALRTGAFPAGSTLKIVNKGYIRGGGGNGSSSTGGAGGTALFLDFATQIDNTSGHIYGGGGGGGGGYVTSYFISGGGGGAGTPAGAGASSAMGSHGTAGTATTGGSGGVQGNIRGGNGGGLGAAGGAGIDGGAGGRGGYSVETNGNAVSWIATGDRKGSVV